MNFADWISQQPPQIKVVFGLIFAIGVFVILLLMSVICIGLVEFLRWLISCL